MRGIICYDFSNDKQRTRLVKILQKYGSRIQYSVFEFRLDKRTWSNFVDDLSKAKFLDGTHNILIIPITDRDHKKIINLGNVFIPFDYETVIYSAFGIQGIAVRDESERKNTNNLKVQTKEIIDKLFKNS
jgi:CRISPR-associated endonuclease Cas2